MGSTPVDFAYAIHTDIGSTCVACRIERRLAPLSEALESGQTVEILTAPGHKPNPAWLGFVVTAKARTGIRHFLKKQKQSESTALGRRLLTKALASFGASLDKLSREAVSSLLEQLRLDSVNRLFEEIGLGNRMSHTMAQRLIDLNENPTGAGVGGNLLVRDAQSSVMNYARCCNPIPGDRIVGYISSERGMVIHTDDCNNISELRANREKWVEVGWDPEIQGEFTVEVRVELEHQRGIIATLATAITGAEANIEKITTAERDAHFSIVNLLINVRNRVHLARVMRKIRMVKAVTRVTRVKSRKARKPPVRTDNVVH